MSAIIRSTALLLLFIMLLPAFTACVKSDNPDTDTSETTAAGEVQVPSAIDDIYAKAGLELVTTVIKNCYNKRTNWLRSGTQSGETGASAVWAVGSFLESLSEAYRLFPDDELIKTTYIDALGDLLNAYKVKDVYINTPNNGRKKVTYYNATRGSSGDYYYDDNAWICIQLLEAYKLLGDEQYLEDAKTNLAFLWTGWDDVLGGGIYWDKKYGSKNTCANGPVAIAFLTAYQLTENEEYLERGTAIWDWAQTMLRDGDLYVDSCSQNGSKNNWKALYNQGVMLYAGSQLYEITGKEEYLTPTKRTYAAAISLTFNVTGTRKEPVVKMNNNPIYKAWCVGWMVRGFMKYYTIDKSKNQSSMTYLELVLDNELKTKDKDGYYDPYFCSGKWGTESLTDVLQPTGVASVFLLAGYFNTHMLNAED